MCGICGFVGSSDKNLLKRMTRKLTHRGPDDDGYYVDSFCSLGNRRLSIIDLEKGKQPIHNENQSVWVVFNGEIYNYRELRKNLEKKHSFYTNSDTEVIVHLYDEYGERFPEHLDGMFAVALWDSEKKKLILVRDRMGIKPLYYSILNDKLLFASEIKAILECDEINRTIDSRSVASFLMYRFVFGKNTVLKQVKKLEPGHMLVKDSKGLKTKKYWRMSKFRKKSDKPEYDLFDILHSSVKKRMISDVPISALLSGGLDSSTVVALMSSLSDKVRTFTVGFSVKGDEFEKARYVSEHFNTEHHEVVVDIERAVKDFKKMIWYMDEPVADTAMVPSFYISEKIRKKAKVALVGEGADEIFGGYLPYKLLSGKIRFLPWNLRENMYFSYSTVFSEKEIGKIIGGDFGVREYFNASTRNGSNLNNILLFDIRNVLPNYQLTRVDRMMMAHSVEARVPFLDTEVLRFSLSLPESEKVRLTSGKHILRKSVSGILPKKVVKQSKRTFFTPMRHLHEKGFYDNIIGSIEKSELTKGYAKFFQRRKMSNKTLWKVFVMGVLVSWIEEYSGEV